MKVLPLSMMLAIAGSLMLAACEKPPSPPPPPPPVGSMAGGTSGRVDLSPAASPTPIPPPPRQPSLVVSSQTAVNDAPADTQDWIDSSWKLFKSSLKTTFTMSAHKVHSKQGDINFTHYQPIMFDVSNLEVLDDYTSPMREPNVEHLMPVSPSDAMHIWVRDRVRTNGTHGALQVIIKNASVVATPLPGPEGAEIHYRRYDARLEVEMRIYSGARAMSDASITIAATQSNTIAEEATLGQRRATYRQMMFDLMDSTNAELEKQIFTHFPRYINYAQTP